MGKTLDWNRYLDVAAKTVAEGIVMLRNEKKALPIRQEDVVSVFGRIQFHYYKSGTGSGGMVNVTKVTGILDGLLEAGVKVNESLLAVYRDWVKENPYDIGVGWGGEPWAQEEMPITEELVADAARNSTCAVVVLGRTAGEDKDSTYEAGSYLLTEKEKDMLRKVRAGFDRMAVLLNVGNIMDMEELEAIAPDAILYVWQGGMTGGTGTAMVLTGKVSPSGKLPDTIARRVEDYPSDKNFGSLTRNYYCEDIYVGYRWFETFARDRVMYPFGFGLSYTSFDVKAEETKETPEGIAVTVGVTNTGEACGKEVVQIYAECPQGKLGKASRVLCGFAKTKELAPGETETLTVLVPRAALASYDDSGVTGHPYCYVLEAGEYKLYAGTDVRSAVCCYSFLLPETVVTETCEQAMAPVVPMKRVKPVQGENGLVPGEEDTPLSQVDEKARREENMPKELAFTGDKGIKLADVYSKKNTMEEFVAQFTEYDLSCIIRGEGMGSPRVTPGTAAAFGGVSDPLVSFGIPAGCCSDGPSGMRMDCGTTAFSLPNGTLIASTFHSALVTELFSLLGLEMQANRVDCLLGPGMNIHRHPLNGRNFEYFSEDPFLTGKIAAAELAGMHSAGVTGTIKHFCANNQETKRHYVEGIISERALREIYLKGFEIAVKEGGATSIMTTYGPVNGLWTAGNFDLNHIILRKEWGFHGITMTDWWAMVSNRGDEVGSTSNLAAMARARNDLYMVCAKGCENDDNTRKELENGTLTRAELQRNAMDICEFLLHTHAMERLLGTAERVEILNVPEGSVKSQENTEVFSLEPEKETVVDLSKIAVMQGGEYCFILEVEKPGLYEVKMTASSTAGSLAQMPVTFFSMGTACATFTWNGTEGKPVSFSEKTYFFSHYSAIRLFFAQGGLRLHEIAFRRIEREGGPFAPAPDETL